MIGTFAISFLLVLTLNASAVDVGSLLEEGEKHLEAWEVPPAAAIADRLLEENSTSVSVLDLKAQVSYYQGRYQEALDFLEKALAIDGTDERRHALRLLVQQTRDTVQGFRRLESEHFILYVNDQRDGILAEPALNTLERSYQTIGEALGYFPQEKVRVEIAPDAPAFNAISTLSRRDIEETGAVGLCKFNKVMTISPRVLIQGYRWLDSLSHEYLHYVIIGLSRNRAPIWVHEGIARFFETNWRALSSRENKKAEYLTPANETLLAQALERDGFVGFKKMEPSLIHLESPEQVQLAYAEAASAIDFMVEKKGTTSIRDFLLETASHSTAEALENVFGLSLEVFQSQWKEFLKSKGLKEVEGSRVRKLRVRGDQFDEEAVELKEIQSAVARKRTHLADRLWERGRVHAAVREYRRALRASPHSMIILNKLARILIHVKAYDEALDYLKKAVATDPDSVTTYLQLGRSFHAKKNYRKATAALEEALQINPFDPTIYHLLSDIYGRLGEQERALKAKEILSKIMRGR